MHKPCGGSYIKKLETVTTSGFATLQMKDQSMYQGFLKEGQIYKLGKYVKRNGDAYIGQFREGKANGYGKFFKNGQVEPIYEGFWRSNLYHGKGRYQVPQLMYEGDFKNGKKEGRGHLKSDKLVIKGEFSNDNADGWVKINYTSKN